MSQVLFPFSEYWQFYFWFTCGIVALLAIDLGVFHKNSHKVGIKEAATWSVVWVSLAVMFWYYFESYALSKFTENPALISHLGIAPAVLAKQLSMEFITGFIIEKSLSVDNLFIFVVIFSYFAIPPELQHRVLYFGIIGALIFRAIFIALGSLLMQYHLVVLIFGILLIATGIKLLFSPEKPADLEKNWALKLVRKFIPISNQLNGQNFFARINSKLYVTPLFLALVVVEATDIIFAVDSVPAIFAITKEPLIVFTSNVFAILGMRSLYFLLLGVYHKFYMLKYGLGIVLMFVGAKMSFLNEMYDGKFPTGLSLAIISIVLASSVLLSLVFQKDPPKVTLSSGDAAV